MSDNDADGRPTIFLVHGFNVFDGGKGTIGKLQEPLEDLGFNVQLFSYGWVGLLGVRVLTESIARRLASLAKPGDIAVGHSNGANIINRAAWEFQAPFELLAYINPALDSDMPLARQVKRALVFYTSRDWVVKLTRILWAHDWGQMGATGYTGIFDRRYLNINTRAEGHSALFRDDTWLQHVAFLVAQERCRILKHNHNDRQINPRPAFV
jgi:hypothetical protein